MNHGVKSSSIGPYDTARGVYKMASYKHNGKNYWVHTDRDVFIWYLPQVFNLVLYSILYIIYKNSLHFFTNYTSIIQPSPYQERFYIGPKSAFTSKNMNNANNILFLWTEWTKVGVFPDCPNQVLPEITWTVQQWKTFPIRADSPNDIVTWEEKSCHCNNPVISIWDGDSCNTGYAGSKCESCADEYYMDDGKCKGMF